MWREEEEEEEEGILLLSFFASKLHLLRGKSGGVRKKGEGKNCASTSFPCLFLFFFISAFLFLLFWDVGKMRAEWKEKTFFFSPSLDTGENRSRRNITR